MNTRDCIKSRRSVRLFQDKPVSDEIVKDLLDSAIHSPSSRDSQSWYFVVIKTKDVKEKLANTKDENNQDHILTAPVTIVVCGDVNKTKRFIEDCAIASQTILLAAHSLGLGSVYVAGMNVKKPEITKELQKILNLPENIIPVTILPIGYPNKDKLEDKKLIDIKEISKEL